MTEESPVRSPKVRNVLITVIVTLLLVTSLVYYARIGPSRNNSESTTIQCLQTSPDPTTSESSQTSLDTTFITHFYYNIVINYSGSWNLVYWGTNGTITPSNYTNYNVKGNLCGTGNYEATIVTYGVGYVENTLCARATKLDSHNGLTLTLGLVERSNSTTASDPSAEVCATFAV
jgi:hypothetical protein